MIKLVITFFFLATVIGFVTQTVRRMTGKELWDLTKVCFFSIMCSLAAIVVMMVLVFLF